jgi:hypothetical protein
MLTWHPCLCLEQAAASLYPLSHWVIHVVDIHYTVACHLWKTTALQGQEKITPPCRHHLPHTTTPPYAPQTNTQTTTPVDTEQVAIEREVPGLSLWWAKNTPANSIEDS